ncbi:DUF192 domain-containing protein [Rhodocista pekingensis]|uniref:DUF192 domain-containing protein n=1 Tax=Rhodocista pekingensis TaxID=201185 RepID=A0ABW2KPU7_9PROT
MQTVLRRLLPLLLVLVTALPAAARLDRSSVRVETASGASHRFEVELALTPQDQARGLMYRDHLDPAAGMLFLYDRPQPASFWMRNTLIPLDIIFIAADGRIVNIAAEARPLDETPLPSDGPILGVLEIGGGLAAKLGIRPGDRVVHSAFEKGK